MEKPNYKIAYCHPASLGGPYTRFQNLSKKLRTYDWKFFFVEVGLPMRGNEKRIDNENLIYIGDGSISNIKQQVQFFIHWLIHENISLIFTYGDVITMHAIPYIPPNIKMIFHCGVPSNTALSHAASIKNRLSRIVANSREIREILINKFKIAKQMVNIIPSAVDITMFARIVERNNYNFNSVGIKLLFFGRISHLQKGTDLLPAIVDKLRKLRICFQLDVVGKGSDEHKLKEQIKKKKLSRCVSFLGEKSPEAIRSMLEQYDVLVMPSRFEGCPNSLLEAMAVGVVPIVTLLKGSTDTIIDHNINGILCPMDDVSAYAKAIEYLYEHPEQLKIMSMAARKKIKENYSLDKIALQYHKLFSEVIAEPQCKIAPLPFSNFKLDLKLYKTWRSYVPLPIRKLYYTWRAKLFYK